MTTGLHHVTLITADVQAAVDFYAGFLGLRLVKQTGGFEDAEQLHLIFGDATGSPGSLVTVLVWEGGGRGRTGLGQVAEIALAVPPASIGDWMTRALAAGLPVSGPAREFGESVLRLKDPDGMIVKLVGADLPPASPWNDAPARLRSATIWTDQPAETAAFLSRFGYLPGPREGQVQRLVSDTDAVDIRDASGYVPGLPGPGCADHLAFRAPDTAELAGMADALIASGAEVTPYHDRKYFRSLYVREPGGTLCEYATEGPGFLVDEPAEALGTTLFLPPGDEGRAAALRVMLPQFARPGEPRMRPRDLPFYHRFHTPADPDGSVLVLLHGSGASETQLLPIAARIAPRATLLALRGRATEDGSLRWFRRPVDGRFDAEDIAGEAAALAAFLTGAVAGYGLDPARLTVLGYSNGANLASSTLALHPGAIARAVLIRPVTVLDPAPAVPLQGTAVLALLGSDPAEAAGAAALTGWLAANGADLTVATADAGHEIAEADIAAARDWLAARP